MYYIRWTHKVLKNLFLWLPSLISTFSAGIFLFVYQCIYGPNLLHIAIFCSLSPTGAYCPNDLVRHMKLLIVDESRGRPRDPGCISRTLTTIYNTTLPTPHNCTWTSTGSPFRPQDCGVYAYSIKYHPYQQKEVHPVRSCRPDVRILRKCNSSGAYRKGGKTSRLTPKATSESFRLSWTELMNRCTRMSSVP